MWGSEDIVCDISQPFLSAEETVEGGTSTLWRCSKEDLVAIVYQSVSDSEIWWVIGGVQVLWRVLMRLHLACTHMVHGYRRFTVVF